MGGWLMSLAKRCGWPERNGFAELDIQIDKFRLLRDSYRLQSQNSLHDRIANAK